MELGEKFISTWFNEGLCVINAINEEDNDLEVSINSVYGQRRTEHWNLEHIIWGFEHGDYTICCNDCTDEKGQNIGNMYRCEKCGRLVYY